MRALMGPGTPIEAACNQTHKVRPVPFRWTLDMPFFESRFPS